MSTFRMFSLFAIGAAACASPARVPHARFSNRPAVTVVDDRRDVPRPPEVREHMVTLYHFDGSFYDRVVTGLKVPPHRRALGVNAFDEVPDSTWFTNRIGVRELTPDEIRRGPVGVGSPEPYRPWTIENTKVGGSSVGFVIRDRRGEQFLLKFDPDGSPEVETAADAIINRLMWAAGYNVPEDHVVYFHRSDLVLSPESVIKDPFGNSRRLTAGELDRRLARVELGRDGQIRGLASRIVPGKSLGGHPDVGVRDDDPNDRIPHELRRDLRGAYALHAWLDQVDVKTDNTLDVWIPDAKDPDRHYVKHYLLDFGKGLGMMARFHGDPRTGVEYRLDFDAIVDNLLTAGMRKRPWEDRRAPPYRGVGLYDVTGFDPGTWKPSTPAYRPFLEADRIDNLWGAKLVMRFTPAQLRAAIEAGRLTDPRAEAYLLETLIARQRMTGAYWFARTSPLDRFAIRDRALCFDDLALVYGLASAPRTRHVARVFDRAGRAISPALAFRPVDAQTCVAVPMVAGGDGYTILRIDTTRPQRLPPIYVHVARDPRTRVPRVIGIWRG